MFKSVERKTGFTLIEVMITVAIIGMLSAFTAYSFATSRPKARLASAQAQLSALQNYLVICGNDGDLVDWQTKLPVVDGVTKICEHANVVAVFPELPDHWSYVLATDLGRFKAISDEGYLWEIECSETGCVTTVPDPE